MRLSTGPVHGHSLPSELGAVHLDGTNAFYVPSDAEVDLLNLPVLEENGTPHGGEDGVRRGIGRQELPCDEPGESRECKKHNVGLDEREVKGNLINVSYQTTAGPGATGDCEIATNLRSEQIPDLIKVIAS